MKLLACVAACLSTLLVVALAELLAFVGVCPSAVLVVASASRNISLENLLPNHLCLSASVGMRQAVQHCQRTQDEQSGPVRAMLQPLRA